MKKILTKILQALPVVFFLLAVVLVFRLFLAIRNDQTPSLFGYSIFLVVSPSMEDTIMTGDLIFVDIDATSFEVGDIITFHQPGEETNLITHRIIAIDNIGGVNYYTTRGDNNYTSLDWEIQFDDTYIIGKYVNKSTFLGDVYGFVFTGGVNLIYGVVVSIFLIIGFTEARSIVRELSKERMRKIEEEKKQLIAIELEKLKKQGEDTK